MDVVLVTLVLTEQSVFAKVIKRTRTSLEVLLELDGFEVPMTLVREGLEEIFTYEEDFMLYATSGVNQYQHKAMPKLKGSISEVLKAGQRPYYTYRRAA